MKRLVRVSLTLMSVSVLLGPALAGEKTDPANAWTAFGPGSWVIMEQRQLAAGAAAGPDKVRRIKVVLEGVKDGRPAFKTFTEHGGVFQESRHYVWGTQGSAPEATGLKASETKDETLAIGERKIDCTVTVCKLENPAAKHKRTLKLWRAKDPAVRAGWRELAALGPNLLLAPDVLRAEYQVEEEKRTGTYKLAVTELGVKVAVGRKEVTCAVETVEKVRSDGIDSATIKQWLSTEVPGHIVKCEISVGKDGTEGKAVITVTDFEAKPAQ
jgi:hypothetical protein